MRKTEKKPHVITTRNRVSVKRGVGVSFLYIYCFNVFFSHCLPKSWFLAICISYVSLQYFQIFSHHPKQSRYISVKTVKYRSCKFLSLLNTNFCKRIPLVSRASGKLSGSGRLNLPWTHWLPSWDLWETRLSQSVQNLKHWLYQISYVVYWPKPRTVNY